MPDRRLLALTEEIYDAATGGTPWSVVGRGLSTLIKAQSASLMVGDFRAGRAELLYHADIPLDAVVAYQRHYRSVDLWTNRAAEAVAKDGPGARPRVWTSGHMVPDDEFLRSEFYGDFGRRLGLRYVVGTVLPLGAAGQMPIGLHRPDGAAPFEAKDARLLEVLLPHLRRALQLRCQLRPGAAAAAPSLAALDALTTGMLVVDAEMQVLVVNAAAEALAAAGRGIRFVRGRTTALTALHRVESAMLAGLVKATALGGSPGGAVRLRDATGAQALAALISPVPRRLTDGSGGFAGRVAGQALVLLRDLAGAAPPPPVELLRALFGLTWAEAEVARALCGGATKEAVATARGCQVSTVRTQVRAVLEKTGAANLRDLERLLARLPGG